MELLNNLSSFQKQNSLRIVDIRIQALTEPRSRLCWPG